MNTKEVEKVLGKKFVEGVSLQDQCTPEQWAEICFISALETEIISEKSKVDRKSDAEIETEVKAKGKKLLDKHGGDHSKALSEL